MPAIKPSSIRDLKDRINIHDVVARSVALKRSGSNYKGLSPFTNEKTPSFYVSPDKGLYKCFSTGQAGDIISFVMETERLNFYEAVEELAKRFNVELEFESGGRPVEDRSLRQELFELHEIATAFYKQQFHAKNEAGEWIRDYWTKSRKFSMEVAEDFGIGFAPADGIGLGHAASKKKFSGEALEKSGLFYTRRGTRPEQMGYRFRGRLMIPIRDYQGRVTAFTARQLEIPPQDDPSREAKYVNSPETPIFNKGSLLFNLDRARMEVGPDTPFVMVEGQLDAIRCSSEGLKGVVAPQGTGITDRQIRLIKRYEPSVRCLLDGDSAGQKAALRMLPITLAQGVETTFITLDEGQDPDDLFCEKGLEAISLLADQEIGGLEFACRSLAPSPADLSPQAKAKASKQLFEVVKVVESSAAQIEFVKEIAHHLDLDEAATVSDYNQFLRGPQKAVHKPVNEEDAPKKAPKAIHSVERDLLILILHFPTIGLETSQIVNAEWIDANRTEGKLLNHILNEFLHDMWNGPESLNESLDSVELQTLAANMLFETPDIENPVRVANEAIRTLVYKHADKKIKQIKLEMGRNPENFNDEVVALLKESSALQKIKANPPQLVTSTV